MQISEDIKNLAHNYASERHPTTSGKHGVVYDAFVAGARATLANGQETPGYTIDIAYRVFEALRLYMDVSPVSDISIISRPQLENLESAFMAKFSMVNAIIDIIKDYGEDALPNSEYRLACNDIIEAISNLQFQGSNHQGENQQ